MGLILTWLVLTLAVWITAMIVPGFRVKSFTGAIFVAAVFGVLNLLLGWLIFAVLGFATLGLGFLLAFVTRWIVNAILLKLTDALTDSLTIDGFGTALIAAAVMSLIGTLGQWLLGAVF